MQKPAVECIAGTGGIHKRPRERALPVNASLGHKDGSPRSEGHYRYPYPFVQLFERPLRGFGQCDGPRLVLVGEDEIAITK